MDLLRKSWRSHWCQLHTQEFPQSAALRLSLLYSGAAEIRAHALPFKSCAGGLWLMQIINFDANRRLRGMQRVSNLQCGKLLLRIPGKRLFGQEGVLRQFGAFSCCTLDVLSGFLTQKDSQKLSWKNCTKAQLQALGCVCLGQTEIFSVTKDLPHAVVFQRLFLLLQERLHLSSAAFRQHKQLFGHQWYLHTLSCLKLLFRIRCWGHRILQAEGYKGRELCKSDWYSSSDTVTQANVKYQTFQ